GEDLVVQTLDQGMDRAKDLIVEVLVDFFSPRAVVLRNDVSVRAKEELPSEVTQAYGPELDGQGGGRVQMNGLSWKVNLLGGQKTGLYLDQRENYVAAARYAHGKALDCFTS